MKKVLFLLLLFGCAKEEVKTPAVKDVVKEEVKLPKIEDITEKYSYRYHYRSRDKRDPFVSLLKKKEMEAKADYLVKGIMWDEEEEVVLIQRGEKSFVLKDGILYDEKGNVVPGIKGFIEGEDVVLLDGKRKIKIPILRY